MIDIPQAEIEESRAFFRSRRFRLDFQRKCLIWLIRRLLAVAYVLPSPLRKLGLSAETARVTVNGRTVRVRIIRPKELPRGIVVNIHGGAGQSCAPSMTIR